MVTTTAAAAIAAPYGTGVPLPMQATASAEIGAQRRRAPTHAPSGVRQSIARTPPSRPVTASSGASPPGPAHNEATENSLTSPPPIRPRAKIIAPARNTAAAHAIVSSPVARLGSAAVAKRSGHSAHSATTSGLGMTSRRISSMAAAAIKPAKPNSAVSCRPVVITCPRAWEVAWRRGWRRTATRCCRVPRRQPSAWIEVRTPADRSSKAPKR